MIEPTVWIHCTVCDEDWPASCYSASGTAYAANRKRACDACFLDLYPQRRAKCSGCGKAMSTRGKFCEPLCRPCRAVRRAQAGEVVPMPPTECIECGESLVDRVAQSDGRCYRCYLRRWRAEQKQASGAAA